MCFQYLNKFFGVNRRRSNAAAAANGGVSPRPSLANGPQVSIETVGTVKSTKSIKSSSASAGKRGVTVVNVNNNSKMGHSMNSLGLERRQSVAAGSGAGGALGNTSTAVVPSTATANANSTAVVLGTAGSSAGPAVVSGAGDNGNPVKRNSWWGFFGIGKKKSRSSSESI